MKQARPDPGLLAIEPTLRPAESVVTLRGRLVIDTSSRLHRVLLQLIRRRVSPMLVIDASDITYLDTSGIATLLAVSQQARAQSMRLRIVGLSGAPRMLAQMVEIDRIFAALGSEVEFR